MGGCGKQRRSKARAKSLPLSPPSDPSSEASTSSSTQLNIKPIEAEMDRTQFYLIVALDITGVHSERFLVNDDNQIIKIHKGDYYPTAGDINRGSKIPVSIFQYSIEEPLEAQSDMVAAIGTDLALDVFLKCKAESKVNKHNSPVRGSESYYCLTTSVDMLWLDWLDCARSKLKNKLIGVDLWLAENEEVMVSFCKFLLSFVYKKKDFVHGNLVCGIYFRKNDISGKPEWRLGNAHTRKKNPNQDNDIAHSRIMLSMMLLCGNPVLVQQSVQNFQVVDSLFTKADLPWRFECLLDIFDEFPDIYDCNYDYFYWCVTNCCLMVPVQLLHHIHCFYELIHVALRNTINDYIADHVEWVEGGNKGGSTQEYTITTKDHGSIFTKVYNYDPQNLGVYIPYRKSHCMRFARNTVVHGSEDYKHGESNAIYTGPQILADSIFKQFRFPLQTYVLIGKTISKVPIKSKLGFNQPPKGTKVLSQQQKQEIRDWLLSMGYLE